MQIALGKKFVQPCENIMQKILIIQAARFGDLLQTKRLIASQSGRHEVHLLTDSSLAALAKLIYPQVKVHELSFHVNNTDVSFNEFADVFAGLKSHNFDRVINCNFSPLTGAVCRLFDADKVVGYRPAHDSDGGFLRSAWVRLIFRVTRLRAASPINLVDFWGWFAPDPVEYIEVNPPAAGKGGGLGIVMAGRESRRSLPVEVLASFVNLVFQQLGRPEIKLFGTDSERAKARALMRLLPAQAQSRVNNLCGKTNWETLISHTQGLDLLLTPDTGIMHLAAHLGVPVLAFFLSSAFCHETGPYGLGHLVWQALPECGPCLENVECGNHLACLESFRDRGFLRFLAASLAGDKKVLETLPRGLQLWSTAYDVFGQRLQLLAGQDDYARKRLIIRNLAASFLRLPELAANLKNMPAREIALLSQELFPVNEWMLPPSRYC